MKKSDKTRSKQSSRRTVLSHKELVAKITEANRAYFSKKKVETKIEKRNAIANTHTVPDPHFKVSEMGTTRNAWTKKPKSKIQIPIVLALVLAILVAGGLIAGVLSLIFLPGAGASHVTQPPAPNYGFDRIEEYIAAKSFIKANYPGAKSFSGCDDSTVQASTDGDCIVTIAVSGVNALNAPIRDSLTVIMKFQDGKFRLQRIDSQNERGLVQEQIKEGY